MKSNEEVILADSAQWIRKKLRSEGRHHTNITLAACESHEFMSRPNWLKSFFQAHNFFNCLHHCEDHFFI